MKEDWTSCRIPTLMAEAIDEFLKTDTAKKNGIFSRSDFVTRVLSTWFSEHNIVQECNFMSSPIQYHDGKASNSSSIILKQKN